MKFTFLNMVLLMLLARPAASAESSWPLWNHYAARFVTAEGRVTDPDRNSMTTSEGQAYAMFFALVAGDASSFERLRSWTEVNLAQGDLAKALPASSWGRASDGSWRILDSNSAAGADLWIAYSLIEADEVWQEPEYGRSGKALLSVIVKQEVSSLPQMGPVLLPGREGFHSESNRWVLNPSYMPLPLLWAASCADPGGPWRQMALELSGWLQQASPAGFAMDWVEYVEGQGFLPASGRGNLAKSPRGSYDAIRVYLWAGMTDRDTPEAEALLKIFGPMARLMTANAAPPESVTPYGRISVVGGPPGFSAALLPFLSSSGEEAAAVAQQERLDSSFDQAAGLIGNPPRYYDQNLALFALGWQERRFRFAPDGTLRVQW